MSAQQAPQHSLYMIDQYNINPAYAGFDRSLSVNLNYRGQWTGLEGNPVQFYANGHLPIYLLNGGAGFSLRRDRTGLINRTEVSISYNTVISQQYGTFSIGGRLGLQQSRLTGDQLITPEGEYISQVIFTHNDPILPENRISSILPTWTIGAFFRNNYFDAGLTITDFVPNRISIGDTGIANNKLASLYTQISLIIRDLEVKPSLLIKSDLNVHQTDLSLIVKSGSVFGGGSIRGFNSTSLESFVIIGGIKLNDHYTLSYSYDVGINEIRTVSQGSHEIHINYNLNKLIGIGLPPEIIYNPRNL